MVETTTPTELRAIRALVPDLTFLVPGIGSQGGDLEAVLRDGPATVGMAAARPGGGLLVNVSRGISGAARTDPAGGAPTTVQERLATAAQAWAARLPVLP